MKYTTSFFARWILVALWISCGVAHAKKTKELKIGMTQEFENLNPLIMSMLATHYIYRMASRTLVVLNPEGQWEPQLAVHVPSFENGMAKFVERDGKKWIESTWHIKPNATWGDGTPVTCHDISFSWRVALHKNTSIPDRETYSNVKEIKIDPKDPKKCTFLESAKWDFYMKGGLYIVPKHLEEPIFEKYKGEADGYAKNSLYSSKPQTAGLYNGPYRISELKLGSHIRLVRNPKFYGKKGYLDEIVIRLIPNTGTLEANLRSGTIDMISAFGLSFDQALAFEKKVSEEKLPYRVNYAESLVYEHIDLNLENPILADVRVRKALVYSINRGELTQALFNNRQKPAIHFLAPIDPWFTRDEKYFVKYPYSRRKARKLLDEAGWKVQSDGYRYKDGKKLKLTIMTTAGNKVRELVEVFLKEQWKQMGIDIEIRNQPARVFFGETVRRRRFEGLAMYAFVSAPESNPRSTLHSESIPTKDNSFSGQNRPGWKNAEVDQAIDAIDVEFKDAGRRKKIRKILHHYTNEVPAIPLYYRSEVSVTPAKLKGYRLPGHTYGATNHIEEWSF